jgi:hypothetical protein
VGLGLLLSVFHHQRISWCIVDAAVGGHYWQIYTTNISPKKEENTHQYAHTHMLLTYFQLYW